MYRYRHTLYNYLATQCSNSSGRGLMDLLFNDFLIPVGDIWESSSHTDIQSSISEKEINEKINGEMKKGGDSNDHITSDKLPSLNDTKKEVFTTVTIVDKEACKVTMSKNDDTCTSDDFREKLEQFIADEEQVDIMFPSTLTSSQRRLIHEVCIYIKYI